MSLSPLSICYYVSGHGLGHASRAAQVIRCFPSDARIYVKTLAPADFLHRAAGRRMEIHRQRFDAGCIQASNFDIDWEQTFAEAAEVHHRAIERMGDEVRWLKQAGINIVVSDAAAPPMRAAREAGIPGVLLSNFTWVDIYSPAARGNVSREKLVRQLRDDYSLATLALSPDFDFPMKYFRHIERIPLIARRGRPDPARLRAELGLRPGHKVVLLYFGNLGDADLRLRSLRKMQNVSFVAMHAMAEPVRLLDPSRWRFQDAIASVDAVVAKVGYGTTGECMANGTPTVYYPRPEFPEYYRIRRRLDEWEGGVRLTSRAFHAVRWQVALDKAFSLEPDVVDASGAQIAARRIIDLA